ncbi:hypothetical protein BH24ACT6_BH24ACT6_03720 [soil metagenome]
MRSPITAAARSSVSAIQWLWMFEVVDELRDGALDDSRHHVKD